MAEISYRLDDLYRVAFPDLASRVLMKVDGVRDVALEKVDKALGNGYQIPTETTPGPQLDFSGIDVVRLVQGDKLSYLGTPIFQPIKFLGGSLAQLGRGAKAGQFVRDEYQDWELPPTTTVEFQRNKALTKSSPNAAYGSVKELWAFEDWDITIRGLILSEKPNVFPVEDIRQALRWEKVTDSIAIAGDMFTYLGISRLVIESFNLGQIAGSPNVRPFQLQCVSDDSPEEAILSNRF